MPQFVCPTCGARLYSASPLTTCAWCGTPLAADEHAQPPDDGDDSPAENDE